LSLKRPTGRAVQWEKSMGFVRTAATAAKSASPAHHKEAADHRPMSRNEEMVYAQLLDAGEPLKAYDLLDRLHDDGLRAPMTIYRALDSLIGRGLARRIASLNAFVALTPEMRAAIGAFVTCTKCGRTRSIGLSNEVVEAMLAPAGMAISDVYIEAFGDCDRSGCGGRPTCGRDSITATAVA
jgi:Fur family transcriptional regulator, zinc uptake regulator